ncbi:MAG: type II toxin-antitoxin system RelE/ParE family toxin [Candidatus Thermoplasmatota archaeon]|nr:type II toxin-antitoxin system RelE/ParE family toxin [Candidatus Thermoplasmatota archaeon]
MKDLSVDPFPSDAKRVVGRKEKVFRVRVGDYRILYVVFFDKNEILISDIDKHERVYNS